MPFDINGFLGKDALKIPEYFYHKYQPFFDLFKKINKLSQKIKNQFKINNETPQELLTATFYIRILEGSQGAIILIERGLEIEASVILRSVFEALVNLKCCITDEKFSKNYFLYNEIKRLKILQRTLRLKTFQTFGATEEDVKKEIESIENNLSEINTNVIENQFKKKELSEKAGLLDLYNSFYLVTSDYAHTNLAALKKHIEFDEHGNIIRIIHGPSDTETKMILIAAVEFLASASIYACNFFKIKEQNNFENLHEELRKLV